jgi:nucleotide-binding universal stress UspA family protein
MYNTILVPLDGSERAEAILCHVEHLAQRYGATVILMQVIEPVPHSIGLEDTYVVLREEYERRTRQAELYLAAVEEKLGEKGIRVQTHVLHGSVVNQITTFAERESVDLVAMASHGRSGLARVFYGSVAAGVLNRISQPLLLIRSRENH